MNNKEKKGILIGTLLGDSSLFKHPQGRNFNIQFTHSVAQKDYATYKANIISQMLFNEKAKLFEMPNYGYKKGSRTIMYRSRVHNLINSVRKILYRDKKKTITYRALDCLTPQGLALWYMDDGCTMRRYYPDGGIHRQHVKLSTCSFSISENFAIAYYFKKRWNINFHVRPYQWPYLTCGVKEGLKFQSIIKEYIIPSMQYKLIDTTKCRASTLMMDDDIVHPI